MEITKKIAWLFLLWLPFPCLAQESQSYKIGCIGFYNLENLFDPVDDPATFDEDFTPDGSLRWTHDLYQDKLQHLAQVIAELGLELTPDGVSILGVAEVENRKVLEDLVRQPLLRQRNYQIIHYDSPDVRGIDVALLYQPKYFKVTASKAIPLLIFDDKGERILTRDILLVSGEYDGEPLHLLINHWPSRRGGEAATQPFRNAGALICKNVCDSLYQLDPQANVIIMGDLNDDPVSPSVRKVLAVKREKSEVQPGELFNPMVDLYKKGYGTMAYRDAWSLFDQLILSYGLTDDRHGGFHYYKTVVFQKKELVQTSGNFKGYPFRTFDGNSYMGGYSDHFPVYLFLKKAF